MLNLERKKEVQLINMLKRKPLRGVPVKFDIFLLSRQPYCKGFGFCKLSADVTAGLDAVSRTWDGELVVGCSK
jgi:hypothetical protein